MSARSIRHRLTIWYVAVLVLALLALAGASWWLLGRAVIVSADASLTERIARARGFIEAAQRHIVPTELQDELSEFGQLSAGEAFIEVRDGDRIVYRPNVTEWAALMVEAPDGDQMRFANRSVSGRPFRVAAATLPLAGHTYHVVAALPLASAYAARAQLGWLLLILLPAIALAAAAGGYVISGRALAPVDRMTRDVRDVSLQNLDRRVDVPEADDELKRLALTFNEMLGRLQTAVADVMRFTAEAAHEMRTPVTLIRATADVALTRPRSDEEYRQALRDVLAQAVHMSSLVADLLALARVDAGVETPEAMASDLRGVAEFAAQEVQPAAARRGVQITLEAPNAAIVRGDQASLRRLVLILLDNAIKYTPPGGRIRLRVEVADRYGVIELIDTGPGIDPAERPFVFDRFYRGAVARAETEGSGLGLSLARAIVERYRGAIDVATGAAGGCRAVVRLPAERGQV